MCEHTHTRTHAPMAELVVSNETLSIPHLKKEQREAIFSYQIDSTVLEVFSNTARKKKDKWNELRCETLFKGEGQMESQHSSEE